MRTRARVATSVRAVLVVLAACGGSSGAPVGTRVGPALSAALTAADGEREPWRCAASDGPAPAAEALAIGKRSWKLADRALSLASAGDLAIGAIADAGDADPATLAALGRLRGKLEHADLVVALGGMGSNHGELEATLGALADHASWPLVVLAGDLEPAGAQTEAIAALRAKGLPVVDARSVRRIELADVTIATLPGAGAASRLVAGAEGCGYRREDVAAAFSDLTPRPGLRILASAEAPRTTDRDPSGDLAITAGAGTQIDIALHGPVALDASAPRSGARDGAAIALTPGSSDALPRTSGPRHAPSAGILTVHGSSWSWKPIADVN